MEYSTRYDTSHIRPRGLRSRLDYIAIKNKKFLREKSLTPRGIFLLKDGQLSFKDSLDSV